MASQAAAIPSYRAEYGIWRVISTSAVGTMIEWYDFYIFGSLAAVLSPKFYPPGNETFALIAYLATFAVGFVVRPFGALVDRLIGVVCLTYNLQMHLGQRVSVDPRGQQRRAQWTVTDRVSWFWCGQRLFDDPGHDWSGWLAQQWESRGQMVTTAPAPPVSETASLSALEVAA